MAEGGRAPLFVGLGDHEPTKAQPQVGRHSLSPSHTPLTPLASPHHSTPALLYLASSYPRLCQHRSQTLIMARWWCFAAVIVTLIASVASAADPAAAADADEAPRVLFFAHTGTYQVYEPQPLEDFSLGSRRTRNVAVSSFLQLAYTDSANVGFNDPTLGATRRACLEAAMAYISSVLSVPAGRTIIVAVSSIVDSTQPFLARGGSFYLEQSFARPVSMQVVRTYRSLALSLSSSVALS